MKIEIKLDEKKMDEIVEQYKNLYNSIYEQILEPLLDQSQDLTDFNEKTHFSTFYHIFNLHLKFSKISPYDLMYNILANHISRLMQNESFEIREAILADVAKFGAALMSFFMETQRKYVPEYDDKCEEIKKEVTKVVKSIKENE